MSIISKAINAFATLGVIATFAAAGLGIGGKAAQAETGGAVEQAGCRPAIIPAGLAQTLLEVAREKALEPFEKEGAKSLLEMLDGQRETRQDRDLRKALEDDAKGGAMEPLPEPERPPPKRFYRLDTKVDKCWKAQ